MGARWIAIASITMLVAICLLPIIIMIFGPTSLIVLGCLLLPGACLNFVGIWQCTSPPEIPHLSNQSLLAGKLARWLILPVVLLMIGSGVLSFFWRGNLAGAIFMMSGLIGGIALCIGTGAMALYCRELAQLFENQKAERLARQYLSAFVIFFTTVLLSALVSLAGFKGALVFLGLGIFAQLLTAILIITLPMQFRTIVENAIRKIPRDPWLANRLIEAEKDTLIRGGD